MYQAVYVALGGAIGALLRHFVQLFFVNRIGISFMGTLFVNATGSLVLGFLIGIMSNHVSWPVELRIFLAIGLLGSYTTFSTLSLEIVESLQRGEVLAAGANLVLSVVLGLLAASMGLFVGRLL
jgi:CrcB protein